MKVASQGHPTKVFAWSWSTVDHLRCPWRKAALLWNRLRLRGAATAADQVPECTVLRPCSSGGHWILQQTERKGFGSLCGKNETRLNQFLNSCGDYLTKLICINTHSSWIFDITRRCHLHCSTNGAEGNVWLFIFGGWLRDAKATTIHWALFSPWPRCCHRTGHRRFPTGCPQNPPKFGPRTHLAEAPLGEALGTANV